MSSVDEKVRRWVTKMSQDITSEGSISEYELCHVVEGEGPQRIQTWKPDSPEPDELAQEFWDKAEEYAESFTRGRRQRFVIFAYRNDTDGERKSEHDTSLAFALSGRGGGIDAYGEDSFPATEAGERGQRLQHDSEMHRMMMQMAEAGVPRLHQEIERKDKRLLELEKHTFDLVKMKEELLDRRQDRELNYARETAKARRVDDMIGMVMAMLPLVAAKLLGPQGIDKNLAASTMRDVSVGKILKNLSQEEFMGILKAMKPGNQLELLELYKSYREDDVKDQEKKPEVLRDEPAEPPKH